jgi:putative acetyltransferase
VIIRDATSEDRTAISTVNAAAFGRADEGIIVEKVGAAGEALVELVAVDGGDIIGHVLFSRTRCAPPAFIAALGPIAVSPDRQARGVGSALVREGVERCRTACAEAIVVLGDPAYYERFGFSAAAARLIRSPYSNLPAFMALALEPGAPSRPVELAYPSAFG